MKSVKRGAEAEIRVENDGSAVLPKSVLRQLHAGPGSKVWVRVTSKTFDNDLLLRGVTEEEIELISAVQFEQRANVVAFLASEGALSADKRFRGKTWRRGR